MIELFSPSEFSYVMNDLKDCPNLEDVSVGQLLEPLEVYNGNTYESDQSDTKPPVAKKKKQSKVCDSTVKPSTSSIESLPCLTPFPGKFDFQLFLPIDIAAHRWTFSRPLNKVFIDIEKVLALQFKWNYFELKPDVQLFVRALPVYTSPDWMKIPVLRCPLHVLPDNPTNTNFTFVEHVIRCEHDSTRYEKDENTKRLSCVTPLSYPQPGSETTTLTYKFVCKTSCPSGMDRKPISVIFTLEDVNGNIFGRQPLAVKICSCPKRDKMKEELNETQKTRTPKVTKPRTSTTDNVSIRNSRGASTSNAEHLKDLQSLQHSQTNDSTSTGSESETVYRSTPTGGRGKQINQPSTSGIVRKRNPDEEVVVLLKSVKDDTRSILQKMHATVKSSSLEVFGHFVAAQLEELPRQYSYELQADIQRLISTRKSQIFGSMLQRNADCLTPAPSLASPESAHEESQLRTPTTPMYTML